MLELDGDLVAGCKRCIFTRHHLNLLVGHVAKVKQKRHRKNI